MTVARINVSLERYIFGHVSHRAQLCKIHQFVKYVQFETYFIWLEICLRLVLFISRLSEKNWTKPSFRNDSLMYVLYLLMHKFPYHSFSNVPDKQLDKHRVHCLEWKCTNISSV